KTTLLTILCIWGVLTWTGAQAATEWQNPESSNMEKTRMNNDFTQNKNVLKEANKETSQQSAVTHIANVTRAGSTSPDNTDTKKIKATKASFSTAKVTTAVPSRKVSIKSSSQATSKRTTVTPRTTTSPISIFTAELINTTTKTTPLKPVSPTATVKLVFDCTFPVPSEGLVLNAIANLLNSRSANIPDTVKVLGFAYNKTSANSYEVFFIISVSTIMPENRDLRKNVYKQIQASIDNTLNRLLNEPGAEPFEH
ncbi:hypothetical protein PGIGA_G00182720, partial [Pangasianodon gigas]|nr:hypothetical protein [Pangasianodon gigas]